MCSTTSYTVLEGLVVSATVCPASRTTDGVSKARRAVAAPTRTWFRSQGSPRGRLGRGRTRSDGQGQQENNFRVCPNPGAMPGVALTPLRPPATPQRPAPVVPLAHTPMEPEKHSPLELASTG